MIKSQWQKIIDNEKKQDYYRQLIAEINQQRSAGINIFPKEEQVLHAFDYQDLPDIKVVILGQDPYHGLIEDGLPQAHGLAFSVPRLVGEKSKLPPSLLNIYKELSTDIGEFVSPNHGNLVSWAEQGVLLLNTVLTVQQAKAHSHAKLGWEIFTDKVISEINEQHSGCVFILWGAHAQKKGNKLDKSKHLVLAGPHPSPLSSYRGFFGCRHFSKTNTWLRHHQQSAIDWCISPNDL